MSISVVRCGVALLVALAFGAGFWMGWEYGGLHQRHATEQKLVDMGLGFWEVDTTTGGMHFTMYNLKPSR